MGVMPGLRSPGRRPNLLACKQQERPESRRPGQGPLLRLPHRLGRSRLLRLDLDPARLGSLCGTLVAHDRTFHD
jgi:hypothetical protein